MQVNFLNTNYPKYFNFDIFPQIEQNNNYTCLFYANLKSFLCSGVYKGFSREWGGFILPPPLGKEDTLFLNNWNLKENQDFVGI